MQVLIPAGGRGVRLRPLTNRVPKPLLPVAGVPILTRIVDGLPPHLPVTILVSAELRAPFDQWKRAVSSRRPVDLYEEAPRQAGPPGPIVALADCLRDRGIRDQLLVLMGDSLQPLDFEEFTGGWSGTSVRIAAYELARLEEAVRFGVIEKSSGGHVTGFEEKPSAPRSPWVFTGCTLLPEAACDLIHSAAAEGLPQMGQLISRCLEVGLEVEAYELHDEWHDIGAFDSYLAAHAGFAAPETRQRLIADDNALTGIVYVHPKAVVERSGLEDSIVFAGAVVRDSRLRRCVVEEGVRIERRSAESLLFTGDGEFPLS